MVDSAICADAGQIRSLAQERLLSTSEAARKLRVTPNAICKLCDSRAVPAFKVGKFWRIPESGLDEYILRGFNGASGPVVDPDPSGESAGDSPADRALRIAARGQKRG